MGSQVSRSPKRSIVKVPPVPPPPPRVPKYSVINPPNVNGDNAKLKRPVLEMTPAQKALIKKSWNSDFEVCYMITSNVYAYVFKKNPETKMLFSGLTEAGEDWRQSRSFRLHTMKFSQMINDLVKYLDTPYKMEPLLEGAGKRHVNYNVVNEMFQSFKVCYMITSNVYAYVFKKNPETKMLFSGLTEAGEDWRQSRSFRLHTMKFSQMINDLVKYLDTPYKMEPLLEGAGQRHVNYNVVNEMFQSFKVGLRLAMCAYINEKKVYEGEVLEDCLRAWDLVTEFIIASMERGLQMQLNILALEEDV